MLSKSTAGSNQPSRVYRLADYKPVLEAAEGLDARAILVGGQAVYFWATRYLDRYSQLRDFMPYTSQDADYLADVPAAKELARHLHSQFHHSPAKGGMLGLSLGDIPLEGDMKVEILGRVNGVKADAIREAAVTISWENLQVRIIHPVQLYVGKGCNLLELDQSDRQDEKHFGIMQWVMRGVLNDFAQAAVQNPTDFLDCCDSLMRFAVSDQGTKLIDLGHMPQTALWPNLTGHPNPKVQNFSQLRVPRWEQQVATRLEKRRRLKALAK